MENDPGSGSLRQADPLKISYLTLVRNHTIMHGMLSYYMEVQYAGTGF